MDEVFATSYTTSFSPLALPLSFDLSEDEQAMLPAVIKLAQAYCGQELGAAVVMAKYNITAPGLLMPFRLYDIGAATSVVDAQGNDVAHTVGLTSVLVEDISTPRSITIIYTEVVPPIVYQAIVRQCGVFAGRRFERPPEREQFEIGQIKQNINPAFLGGLASDVRYMLSPYRRLRW